MIEIDLERKELFEILVMAEDKIHFEIEYLQRLIYKYSGNKSVQQEISNTLTDRKKLLHKISCNISELMTIGYQNQVKQEKVKGVNKR